MCCRPWGRKESDTTQRLNNKTFRFKCEVGPSGRCAFNFLRNCQTVFQRGGITLHSHQQHSGVPVAPHHLQHYVRPGLL